ncbi:unnamed protein product [Closterium sp. NIES-65]|nr:unnamed protein product [Closterium sp. NIES-65]
MPMFHHAYDSLTMPMFHHAKLSVPACPFLSYYVQDDIHSYSTLHAALDHLLGWEDIDVDRIVVFGRSLGGAVGADLVHRNPHKASQHSFNHTPPFVDDSPPTDTPILFLSGAKDELMPPAHMRQLYAEAQRNTGGSSLFVEVAAGWPHGHVAAGRAALLACAESVYNAPCWRGCGGRCGGRGGGERREGGADRGVE